MNRTWQKSDTTRFAHGNSGQGWRSKWEQVEGALHQWQQQATSGNLDSHGE